MLAEVLTAGVGCVYVVWWKVVYERNRTGFEDSKDLQPAMGSLVAGRYRVRSFLGSAVFSTAIECQDLLVPNKDEVGREGGPPQGGQQGTGDQQPHQQ